MDATLRLNVYIDGELVEPNLFSRLRAAFFASVAVFCVVVVAITRIVMDMF